MKCIAARVGIEEHDKEDSKHLIQHLRLRDCKEVEAIVAKYYDERRIPAKTRYFIQEICDELFSKTGDVS
jgi:hypothetical protein